MTGQVPVQKKIIDYPRAGKTGFWRWIPSWRLVLGLMSFCFVSGVLAIGVAYAKTDVPEIAKITEAQTSIVYYDDGKTELGRFQVQNRVILDDDQIPRHLKDAVIAAEDRTFYSNRGISPTGIARAAINNLRGGSLQGGSTLTQQYVKNVLLNTQDRTYTRKVKEFFIAVKVARDTDKEKILDSYLNTIYLGRNSYGVEAASQTYFRKSAAKLDVSQAAFIAGIINGPELYDPEDGEEAQARAEVRWNYVLDSMVGMGTLSAADRAQQEFPKVKKARTSNSQGGQKGYLLQMVRAELKSSMIGFSDAVIDTQGLRITTTFNKAMVDAAAETVKETLPEDTPKHVRVAVSTVDPATGAVKAIYGGKDFLDQQFNDAVQGQAQAGSTFKPFTLVAALEKGIGLKSTFDGHSPQEFAGFERPVENYSNEQFGQIDLITATEHSVNTVYVALNEEVGADLTKETALKAGLSEGTSDLMGNPANVLGTASVYPIDMATAYGTFANKGVRAQRFVVAKVTGPTEYEHEVKTQREFKEDVMADTVYAMEHVVESGTGAFARNLGRPAAGKTGTSSDFKSAWFVGFTPQLSTSVAMFREEKVKGKLSQVELGSWGGYAHISGGSFPTVIWTNYMKKALDGTKVEQFPEPEWIGGEIRPTITSTTEPTPTRSTRERPTRPTQEQPTETPIETSPELTQTPEPTDDSTPTTTDPGGGGGGGGGGFSPSPTTTPSP